MRVQVVSMPWLLHVYFNPLEVGQELVSTRVILVFKAEASIWLEIHAYN